VIKKIFLIILLFILFSGCTSIKTKEEVSGDFFNLGNEYFSLKNYKKAIESYNKALSYNSNFNQCVINLVLSYQMDKQYDKAEDLIIKRYKPLSDDYYKKLLILFGNNYFYIENYDKSLRTFQVYIESYPDEAIGYFNLGQIYLKLSDENNALKYFLEAFNKDKKFIPVIFNLANFYFEKHDYESSVGYLKLLIDLDKDNPAVYFKIGIIEYQIEEYEIARTNFNKAILLEPKNPDYYLALAKVYAKGFNNKAKAYENIEKALVNDYQDIKSIREQKEFSILLEYSDFKDLLRKYELRFKQ
jgi:tetratricopeptide (TPR) repeat protein